MKKRKKEKKKNERKLPLSVILDKKKAQLKDEIRELKKLNGVKYIVFFIFFVVLGMAFALYNHNSALKLEEIEEYHFQSTSNDTYYSEINLDDDDVSNYRLDVQEIKDVSEVRSEPEEEKEVTQESEALRVSARVASEQEIISLSNPVEGELALLWREPYKDRILDAWKFNSGIDIKASIGTKVKAAQRGYVEELINDDYRGMTIIIKHNDTYKTLYKNLKSSYIEEGEEVSKGQAIGEVGDSGRNEDNVFHFELLKFDGNNYNNISPLDYIK
ncbi:M23 family metallopeptidase [Halonatronum saccharophilum]|uniref:M23 family metallopeptidase n=1 Tax=Halonatronum saccharophilum TaxID=150060 RepID=UPI0004AFE897|nr:M23 family metallopeptidase [Halonatronum saccharophilum]